MEKAMLDGKSLIVEMDSNSKMGSKYISKDPHEMSPNGAILASIVERQHLVVVNGSSICQGVITQRRVTKNRTEESAIDVVLVSRDMAETCHVVVYFTLYCFQSGQRPALCSRRLFQTHGCHGVR